MCSVEYELFQFGAYPPHVRNLKLYAFKPLLLAVSSSSLRQKCHHTRYQHATQHLNGIFYTMGAFYLFSRACGVTPPLAWRWSEVGKVSHLGFVRAAGTDTAIASFGSHDSVRAFCGWAAFRHQRRKCFIQHLVANSGSCCRYKSLL